MVKGCRCATSWFDLDLTFDLAVVTLSLKILNCLVLVLYLYIRFLSLRCSLFKHYLDLYISDTALKVPRSLYCFYVCFFVLLYIIVLKKISPGCGGMGISGAIFLCIHFLSLIINARR